MLKRSVTAIRRWLSPERPLREQLPTDSEVCPARRGFFTKAAVGAVSITGTAGLAKAVVDSVPQPDQQGLYRKDHLAGEQELMQREYVLMSDREKENMVKAFVDNYTDQT